MCIFNNPPLSIYQLPIYVCISLSLYLWTTYLSLIFTLSICLSDLWSISYVFKVGSTDSKRREREQDLIEVKDSSLSFLSLPPQPPLFLFFPPSSPFVASSSSYDRIQPRQQVKNQSLSQSILDVFLCVYWPVHKNTGERRKTRKQHESLLFLHLSRFLQRQRSKRKKNTYKRKKLKETMRGKYRKKDRKKSEIASKSNSNTSGRELLFLSFSLSCSTMH